jgi:hypothetical protein
MFKCCFSVTVVIIWEVYILILNPHTQLTTVMDKYALVAPQTTTRCPAARLGKRRAFLKSLSVAEINSILTSDPVLS